MAKEGDAVAASFSVESVRSVVELELFGFAHVSGVLASALRR
jgi:hypothetical protein